ncbi:proline/betaine ABC transporter permease ProW, partial [Dickeya dadantii]|nr:proline/betaine ABC transporter permease ProW [Dickeya dadantii]
MTDTTQNPWEEDQAPDQAAAANHSHAAATSGEHAAAAGSSGTPAQTDPWAASSSAP